MPYRIDENESVAGEVERIALEQIGRSLAEIDDESLERHETIHQVRKRCKKVRGLLRLVRAPLEEGGLYTRENRWFRDAARQLSGLRDAEALIETYDRLLDHFDDQVDRGAFGPIRRKLTLRRNEIAEREADLDARLASVRRAFEEARQRVGDWAKRVRTIDELLPGLAKTYGRGRAAMEGAYRKATPERFHEWRKRAKYHWYHCRLLRNAWPSVVKARESEADRLSDRLGDEHDLSVFRRALVDEGEWFGRNKSLKALLALIERRQRELRRRIRPLGLRIYAEKPKHLRRRIGVYWDAKCPGDLAAAA